MFTAFKPYLVKEYCLFNDSKHAPKLTTGEPNYDVILAKLKRFDFENALREVENWGLE